VIQVCSQCATRWNVRERRRESCPRCRGALLAPVSDAPSPPPPGQRTAHLPPGYRWIAVRPGAAPPAPRRRRPRGPTPRYAVIPRWGLRDRVTQGPGNLGRGSGRGGDGSSHTAPPTATIRALLFVGILVLCLTALVYVVRYALLVFNRNTLLNSLVAIAANVVSVLASLVAIATVATCGVVLVRWLIARRAAVFAHHGLPESRSVQALWAGCVTPLANLALAPVYVIELATLEDRYARIRRPILQWWIAWVLSYLVAFFAIRTSSATDAQGIANNTVLMVFAYLLAAITLAAAARVFEGFESSPVERPAHRWVVAASDDPGPAPVGPVELADREPAA